MSQDLRPRIHLTCRVCRKQFETQRYDATSCPKCRPKCQRCGARIDYRTPGRSLCGMCRDEDAYSAEHAGDADPIRRHLIPLRAFLHDAAAIGLTVEEVHGRIESLYAAIVVDERYHAHFGHAGYTRRAEKVTLTRKMSRVQ